MADPDLNSSTVIPACQKTWTFPTQVLATQSDLMTRVQYRHSVGDWSIDNPSEQIVRKSLDTGVVEFWNLAPRSTEVAGSLGLGWDISRCHLCIQLGWMDLLVFPLKPPTENPDNNPAHYFKPDLIISQEFKTGPLVPIVLKEALQQAPNLIGHQIQSKLILEHTFKKAEYNAFINSITLLMPILYWSPRLRKSYKHVFKLELIAFVTEYKKKRGSF
ncbi:hypothetical protein K435DRAFT_797235 [Dendrothele bispora CBS 962.96]|uniref:Uncharacterized protein n=1 Tax=Dendrothele bispora (strain CBS 962.96) TaxID=1314807 RepID=A0A4S8M330_DENBC|nr:hypothetical protein K435DRAFT_797235 [Dendrothele bispora CBS 962.96]